MARTSELHVVDGPNFASVMNSLSAPQLGDAYPVSFTVRIAENETGVYSGKVVGLDARGTDDTVLFGLRVQLKYNLDKYDPLRLEKIDLIFPVYNTKRRSGSVTFSVHEPRRRDLSF